MKAPPLLLFSFLMLFLAPHIIDADKEKDDKMFLPSPVGLEISYDDGDTYYYYNNQHKKVPINIHRSYPKDDDHDNDHYPKPIEQPQIIYPPKGNEPQQQQNQQKNQQQNQQQQKNQQQQHQNQNQNQKQQKNQQQQHQNQKQQQVYEHNKRGPQHLRHSTPCSYDHPYNNENHWTYADDNDNMMVHRRCWLYRDKHSCRRAECCWFEQECHGCHDDSEP